MAKKCRLLGGEHVTQKWVLATKEEARSIPCTKDEITGEYKRLTEESYLPGDIIESDRDLVAMFGRNKFELMPDDTPLRQGGPTLRQSLEQLTISQLKELATEREISLEGASKKQEMIDAIVSALEGVNV
jgi:hypothetical protein